MSRRSTTRTVSRSRATAPRAGSFFLTVRRQVREIHAVVQDANDVDPGALAGRKQDRKAATSSLPCDMQRPRIPAEFGAVTSPHRVRAVIEFSQGRDDCRPVTARRFDTKMPGRPLDDCAEIRLGGRQGTAAFRASEETAPTRAYALTA